MIFDYVKKVAESFRQTKRWRSFQWGKVVEELFRIIWNEILINQKNQERRSLDVFCLGCQKELTGLEVHREHAKAELAALIRMNGSLSLVNQQQFVLNVQTENAAIARRIFIAERSLPCTSRIISS